MSTPDDCAAPSSASASTCAVGDDDGLWNCVPGGVESISKQPLVNLHRPQLAQLPTARPASNCGCGLRRSERLLRVLDSGGDGGQPCVARGTRPPGRVARPQLKITSKRLSSFAVPPGSVD
jgi:hypothetical protein